MMNKRIRKKQLRRAAGGQYGEEINYKNVAEMP